MKSKITELISSVNGGYNWQYCSLGGVTRVKISTGEDIAHLHELDQTMWTVLSCPVKGLELEERTLHLMDTDNDGKIRVDEVTAASQWLCQVLRDPNKLIEAPDMLTLSDLNQDSEEGAKLYANAQEVLKLIGENSDTLSLTQLNEFLKAHDKTLADNLEAAAKDIEGVDAPYGDNTADAVAAVNALRDKMADFYMRCRFIQFHNESSAALDVDIEKVAALSQSNIATGTDEISKYPISRPIANAVMPINEGLNPAWADAVAKVKNLILEADYPGKESISEAEWGAIVGKIDAYTKALADHRKALADDLNEKSKAVHELVEPVEKLLRLTRDFYTLLRNYVMMIDFYDQNKKAIFQAGKLYIDSRCCELCMKVTDMGTQALQAPLSGMYLIYCTCTSRSQGKTMDIVAAMTDGDVDDLRVGKNAVFYDAAGNDWDATVTKIIDNPISIRQAFWSPYKKFFNWVTEKLNKSAAEKEAKSFDDMTANAEVATTNITNKDEEGKTKNKKQAFDIAKFAGIFAAIGMAVGFILEAFTGIFSGLFKHPKAIIPLILLIMLCISGPSMFIAWMKLRKRNLSHVLNANGWAINSRIVINVKFGATLTYLAKYPKVMLEDPFAEKKMPKWLRWVITVVSILAILFVFMFFTNRLEPMGMPFNKEAFKTTFVGKIIYGAGDMVKDTVKDMDPSNFVNDSAPEAEVPAEPAAE